MQKYCLPNLDRYEEYKNPWVRAQYGAHPRSVIITDVGGVEMLDLRVSHHSFTTF